FFPGARRLAARRKFCPTTPAKDPNRAAPPTSRRAPDQDRRVGTSSHGKPKSRSPVTAPARPPCRQGEPAAPSPATTPPDQTVNPTTSCKYRDRFISGAQTVRVHQAPANHPITIKPKDTPAPSNTDFHRTFITSPV